MKHTLTLITIVLLTATGYAQQDPYHFELGLGTDVSPFSTYTLNLDGEYILEGLQHDAAHSTIVAKRLEPRSRVAFTMTAGAFTDDEVLDHSAYRFRSYGSGLLNENLGLGFVYVHEIREFSNSELSAYRSVETNMDLFGLGLDLYISPTAHVREIIAIGDRKFDWDRHESLRPSIEQNYEQNIVFVEHSADILFGKDGYRHAISFEVRRGGFEALSFFNEYEFGGDAEYTYAGILQVLANEDIDLLSHMQVIVGAAVRWHLNPRDLLYVSPSLLFGDDILHENNVFSLGVRFAHRF
ncbi:hypothetical protein KQI65_09880 [bacterium]|nr:hypothetical protein [bacterium]